jgi:hypothetical protein
MPLRLLVVITTEVADGALRDLIRRRAGDNSTDYQSLAHRRSKARTEEAGVRLATGCAVAPRAYVASSGALT